MTLLGKEQHLESLVVPFKLHKTTRRNFSTQSVCTLPVCVQFTGNDIETRGRNLLLIVTHITENASLRGVKAKLKDKNTLDYNCF